MSLLSVYQREIIPYIEEKHDDIYEVGHFKVATVKQEDDAGPNHYTVYLREILEEFCQRDWVILHQPPQSPSTNAKDVCLFPM